MFMKLLQSLIVHKIRFILYKTRDTKFTYNLKLWDLHKYIYILTLIKGDIHKTF